MTLRHLKIFVCVCKEMSITKAARKLFVSQPAISNAIKEMEIYYQTPLFDRISKRLYLTEAGRSVYHYAQQISGLFEELEMVLSSQSKTPSLRIGSSITIGTHFMPDYIKTFSQLLPNVKTFVTIDSSDVIENLILSNELDLALIEGNVHSEHIITKDFKEDELALICSPKSPLLTRESLTMDQVSKQPFLMREKNSGTRESVEALFALHNSFVTPIWESTSTEAIIHAVAKGIGISILPLKLVQDSIDCGKICKLNVTSLQFYRQFHIIYHKNKYLTPAALSFMNLCLSK